MSGEQGSWAGTPTPLESRDSWSGRVRAAANACERGALEKVVLARGVRVDASAPFDPWATFAALCATQPESWVYAVGVGDAVLVGASPERLAEVRGRRLSTHALAGTAPIAGAGDLGHSRKDHDEHGAVVAGLREDLAPLCEGLAAGPARVRTVRQLAHLETPISATLRPGVGLGDVVAALHPTAALGGRPRGAARAWLRASEPLDRGWFGAPVGYETPEGGVAVVAIRCALLRGCTAHAFAGAGIVAGSDPDAEWAETELKLRTVLGGLRTAEREAAHAS